MSENYKFPKISPMNNTIMYYVDINQDEDVNIACSRAKSAFEQWRKKSVRERIKILKTFCNLIEKNKDLIINTICEDISKPQCEAETEVIESQDIINYYTSLDYSEIEEYSEIQLNQELWKNKKSYYKYEPIGVYAVMKPWNYPFEMAIWSLIPILIAGNTVVFKPSEYSTKTGLLLNELLNNSGMPEGVFNLVQGDSSTGELLINNKNIDAISFTGSTKVGKLISETNKKSIKKLNLELGGSDYALVLEDCDIELAISGLLWGAFSNAGQVCVATEKILVHEKIYNKFKNRFIEEANKLEIGKDISPLITKGKLEDTIALINEALGRNCNILTGGHKYDELPYDKGNYLQPTIIECHDKEYMNSLLELFAPLVYISSFKDIDEAIKLINNSKFGLGCSIWTSNIEMYSNILNDLQVGMLWINEVNLPFPQVPWLGRKESSFGFNLSKNAVYDAMNLKVINNDFSNTKREWWYPYK